MTVFPNTLDTDLELPRVDNNVTEIGGEAINALRDAIMAIEQNIGVNVQGNKADLVTRISRVIDKDGNIKTSAIEAHGLASLPISDTHISSKAAIQESKIDLDYTTSSLNARILSNVSGINAVITSITALTNQAVAHFAGSSDKHDGYDITITAIRSSDDVETALNAINNALVAHEDDTIGAHAATSIGVNNEFQTISATNVQSALNALDDISGNALSQHQDRLHRSGIPLHGRGEKSLYGNLKETTMAGTIYQTDTSKSTNIYQVMRPNVARVTGDNIDFRALKTASAQYLRIQAGGMGRSTLDVDLSSVFATDDIEDIVYVINYAAHAGTQHYPISAYNTGGKITIAHTIPGKQYTIQVLDNITFSAATALGFASRTNTIFEWADEEHYGYAGGSSIKDMKSLIKQSYAHNTSTSTISLGLGDLSSYGLTTGNEGRVLCNITNHSNSSSANGTYYIISYPTSGTFTLSESIAAGTFDIEIASDAVNFQNSTNGELYDIFVSYDDDGYGLISKSNRVSYGPLSGISIRSVSTNFPTNNMQWKVSGSNAVSFVENGEEGNSTSIPTSFTGQLKVYAPDNINSALVDVTGNPGNGTKSMTVSAFAGDEDNIYIGSVHYAGSFGLSTLKFPTDRRQLGTTVDNQTDDKLAPVDLETAMKELRSNGIIRGFEVISSDDTSFRIRGGRALIDGRIVDVETQDITINDFSTATNLLLVDRSGTLIVKNEFDPGYSFAELTAGDAYGDDRGVAIICEFETDGSSIDGYFTDRRLRVNKIDKRLSDNQAVLEEKISEIRSTAQGSEWGFQIIEANADGYLAGLETGFMSGFGYVPDTGQDVTSAYGFSGGSGIITTRRFEFSDISAIATSIFRPTGMTHINVFAEATYTGLSGGPFGVSGTVYVELGAKVETGMTSVTEYDDYARIKTINTGVFTSDSQVERYVASIPVARLNLGKNVFFDVVPRVKIINSNLVDGGSGSDSEPTIRFDNIRIVVSSYSIAGAISGTDGSTTPVGVSVGEIL